MKAVLQVMTEETHDKRTWKSTSLVVLFVGCFLALNASLRELTVLIESSSKGINDNVQLMLMIAVTLGQILLAAAVISSENTRGDWPNKEALTIIIFSHVGATFLHDYLLGIGTPEKSLATSYLQPLFALVSLWVITGAFFRPATLLGVVSMAAGCTLMSLKLSAIFQSDRTSLICGLSMFAMILRNITIRQLVCNEAVQVKIRNRTILFGVFLSVLGFVISVTLLTETLWTAPTICAVATCFFSTCLLYVTTLLLRVYSVTFLALFSTGACLVEAFMITSTNVRPDILSMLAALAFLLSGFYIFVKDHLEHEGSNSGVTTTGYPYKPVNSHEQYTRTEFLIFASAVMGVIFYVFQPKVSERDLENLSYVGLDKVIRRLLAVNDGDLDSK